MKICLIVINYNGLIFLPEYLPQIKESCRHNHISLLVTDDNSTDGSVAYLQESQVSFTVNNEGAHGFAANVNHGIRYADLLDNFDYYIISNNDIQFNDKLFEAMKLAVSSINETDKQHGLIGFHEVLEKDRQYYDAFDYKNYRSDIIKRVKEIPGFFFIISRKLINSIGLFDEEYFMYGEDNDYYTRAVKAGFSIYNTGLPVMHYSEGSSSNAKQTSWYVYRNALLFAQKNQGTGGFIKMIFSLLNQVYNPFFKTKNPGNERVRRNGFFYNNYLLMKSIAWNLWHMTTHRKKINK